MAKASINIAITGIEAIEEAAQASKNLDKISRDLDKALADEKKATQDLAAAQLRLANATTEKQRQAALKAINKSMDAQGKARRRIEELTQAEIEAGKVLDEINERYRKSQTIMGKFGLALDSVKDKFDKVNNGLTKQNLFTGLSLGAAGIGAAFAGAIASFQNMRTEIDETAKAARGLGLSQAEFKAFEIAAGDAGTSIETFEKAIQTSANVIGKQLINPTAEAGKAFEALGLDVQELGNMSAQARFDAIYEGLQGIDNETERARLATQLFGSEFAITMSNMSNEGFERARNDVERFGLALDDVTAGKIESFNDNFGRIGMLMDGVQTQIAGALAPALDNLMQLFVDSGISGKEMGEWIGEAIKGVINAIMIAVGTVRAAWNIIKGIFNFFKSAVAETFAHALLMLGAFIDNWNNLPNLFKSIINVLIETIKLGMDRMVAPINGILAYFGKEEISIAGKLDQFKFDVDENVEKGVVTRMGESMAEVAKEATKDLKNNVQDAVGSFDLTFAVSNALDSDSPNIKEKAKKVGNTIGKNVVKGINDVKTKQEKAMQDLSDKYLKQVQKENDAEFNAAEKKRQDEENAIIKARKEKLEQQQKEMQQVLNPLSKGLETIAKGTESVSQAFETMVRDIIVELTRLATQKAFTAFFGGGTNNWLLGGNGGGLLGGIMGLSSGIAPMSSSLSNNYTNTASSVRSSNVNRSKSATVNINVVGGSGAAETGRQIGVQTQRSLQSAFR